MTHSNKSIVSNYPAPHFINTNNCKMLVEVIEEDPLATLLLLDGDDDDDAELHISHIPFHFSKSTLANIKGKYHSDLTDINLAGQELMAHVSNKHPLAQNLKVSLSDEKATITKNKVTLIFNGEDDYISPHDVSAEFSSQQKVPTWNYAKVHVTGHVSEVKDIDDKYQQMLTSTDYFEQIKVAKGLTSPDKNTPWSLDSAPSKAIESMLKAITIFKLTITNIEGRFKLSQNKSDQVRQQIAKQVARREKHALANQISQQ